MNGLTLSQLHRSMRSASRCTLEDAKPILAEMQAAGLVERDGAGRWRLTPDADRRFGLALRQVTA